MLMAAKVDSQIVFIVIISCSLQKRMLLSWIYLESYKSNLNLVC